MKRMSDERLIKLTGELHGTEIGREVMAAIKIERARVERLEDAIQDWDEWRDRHGIKSQSAVEEYLLAALRGEAALGTESTTDDEGCLPEGAEV